MKQAYTESVKKLRLAKRKKKKQSSKVRIVYKNYARKYIHTQAIRYTQFTKSDNSVETYDR